MSGISTDSAVLICVCVFTRVEDLGGNMVRAWGTKSCAGQGLVEAWINQKTFLQKTEI